ncbi:intraflagellar transport protein 22 homolog isoform X1 [Helicoverpa zea]|uniref:intraflagellar transport protein 22 homolog isoform X1 n=2 Tax=Helicoverpa zea TaxID=7113 RepID=UPI001F587D89|nr:intraflagellar transport protein 22 homolog isoform X1 [Helicoverpa armigera]XP_047029849.1 intraflagellar transport protein 22 homolog isoform X1 [Helicoverpa zea]
MQPNKLKILMIGPSESGKTSIANFISDSMNVEEVESPRPTQGVRIVEFELPNLNINGKTINIDIELWDCSGDHRFESCWPALRVGVQGVVLVCSPNTAQAAAREMELLYNYFVSQPKLSAKQCVLFYNCTDDQEEMDSLSLSPTFSKVSQVAINLKTGGNRLKIDFASYITSVLQSINKENS